MRALLVGLFALVLVTQAAAAATQAESADGARKTKVDQRLLTLDETLERKLAALRRYRGTLRFFQENRELLGSHGSKAKAKAAEANASTRVRQLTRTVQSLRTKIRARTERRLASLPPRKAICTVFDSQCEEAVAVAWCESRLQTTARNGQYLGMFQMGSRARRLFGHGATAHAQAQAAHRYFVQSGHDWSPWGCRWAAS